MPLQASILIQNEYKSSLCCQIEKILGEKRVLSFAQGKVLFAIGVVIYRDSGWQVSKVILLNARTQERALIL